MFPSVVFSYSEDSGMAEREPPDSVGQVIQERPPPMRITVGKVEDLTGVGVSRFEEYREKVAGIIALGLFGLFALTVLLPIIDHLFDHWFQSHPHQCDMGSFIETMAAHEVILLAIIIAFYFSERRLETKS